jgi:hypothetical protein
MKTSKNYINYIYLVGVVIFFYIISRYIFGTNKIVEGFQPFNYIFNFWMDLFNFCYNVFEYGTAVWKWNMFYQDPFSYQSKFLKSTSSPPPNPANITNIPNWVKYFFPTPATSDNSDD